MDNLKAFLERSRVRGRQRAAASQPGVELDSLQSPEKKPGMHAAFVQKPLQRVSPFPRFLLLSVYLKHHAAMRRASKGQEGKLGETKEGLSAAGIPSAPETLTH